MASLGCYHSLPAGSLQDCNQATLLSFRFSASLYRPGGFECFSRWRCEDDFCCSDTFEDDDFFDDLYEDIQLHDVNSLLWPCFCQLFWPPKISSLLFQLRKVWDEFLAQRVRKAGKWKWTRWTWVEKTTKNPMIYPPTNIAHENPHYFSWWISWKWRIFHGYASLQECSGIQISWLVEYLDCKWKYLC